ncbi:MAG: ComEC/Rec2 family competence protein, partial [Alistipes sp.]|nr:ComEC/Rec2 family competence protein [Alistipes sp.]
GENPVRPNALKITFLSWGTGSTKLSYERALPERQQSAEICASIIGAGWDGYHNSPLGMTLRYGHKFFLGNYSPSRPLDGFFVRPEAIYCHYGYDSASDGTRQISQMGALLATAGYQRAFGRWLGGVGISDYNIIGVTHSAPTDLQSRAIARLDRYATDDASHATVVAMVAGSRHAMPNDLRDAYSKTGLSHLMAVSGLHLGIVLMVVGFMLLPLRFVHRGHRIAALLAIVAIWFYAIMSGASPSVVRAAVMLSVLQLSLATSARYNSLNALAVTVFAMLVYRPSYLFDISFQLSVAAVFGIVAWAVPMMRASRQWPRPVKGLSSLIVVGVVATLWTLPIVSHTFGNLPIIGVVVTPCVMLFAYAIVACGILAVVLPTPVGYPFAAVAEWAAHIQNIVVEWAANLPFALVEYAMPKWGVALCYLTYTAITLLYWSKNQKKVITLSRYADPQ